MAFLNRKIRAVYAGALGALGFAVGSAAGPISARSQDEKVTEAPIYLRAARTSPKAASAPARAVTVRVERKIEGKPIEWWRARAVQNRRTINRLSGQSSNSSSNQSSNSSSNQSSNSSSN